MREDDYLAKIRQIQRSWDKELQVIREDLESKAREIEEIVMTPTAKNIEITKYLILWAAGALALGIPALAAVLGCDPSRAVAQPGSVPEWGSGGRGFKSPLPDQTQPLRSFPVSRDCGLRRKLNEPLGILGLDLLQILPESRQIAPELSVKLTPCSARFFNNRVITHRSIPPSAPEVCRLTAARNPDDARPN